MNAYSLDKQVQYQVVYVYVISGMILCFAFAGVYYYLGLNVIATVMSASAIITFIVIYLLPIKISADSLVHLILVFLFIILIIANFYLGGFDNPNDVWFMVFPVIAGLLIKKQPVWFYSVISLLIVVVFFLLKKMGIDIPLSIDESSADIISLANRLGAVLALSLLIVLYRYEWYTKEKKLRANQLELFELANFDPLTKLANRSYFAKEFANSIAQSDKYQQSLAMLFIDLDSFKVINDTYGHNIGDELLLQVAERFKNQLHGSGFLCRHGGDEFLIMMNIGTSNEVIEDLSYKLINGLNTPFQLKNHTANIGCSIGIAFYPEHGNNFLQVLRAADIAMYRAKSLGSAQFQIFNEQLSREVKDKNQIAIELRHSIDNDQLVLSYQAKYSLSKQSVIGHEALLRWKMANGQSISPEVFIEIAEEFSLISKLGDWTLRNVCKQLNQWHIEHKGRHCIAINISAKQIFKQDFIASLIVITEHYNVLPEQLELELTEGVFVDSSFKVLHTLQQLHDLGFKLIIDDYGSGYASIGYLKKFPVSGLKIDRSFIKDILSCEQDRTIVKSTIKLAHQLGLQIIAEGVEDKEQADMLASFNCDIVQGYYFGKPKLAEDLEIKESLMAGEYALVMEE